MLLFRRPGRRRWALVAGVLAAAIVAGVVALTSAGGSVHHRTASAAPAPAAPAPVRPRQARPRVKRHAARARRAFHGKRLAIGLTEPNANLLWNPRGAPGVRDPFGYGRALLSAVHPAYVRVVVNWAALQPTPGSPARLDASADGCERGLEPCASFGGLRAELSAIASQQRAGGGYEVVMVIAGVPGWAAHAPQGCERAGTTAYSRPIRPAALSSYRSLVRSLLALGSSVGVSMPWWTPWNEPNHPAFVSPQRAACSASSPSLAPGVYAELERAMAAELQADGTGHRVLLGELAGLTLSSPRTTSIAEFVAALPADVVCASDVWSVHAYPGARATALSPVSELESALDGRGACGRHARVWVTETGAGGVHAGDPRGPGLAQQVVGCQAMATQLDGWYHDPRVDAAFQYEFRDDTRFPVGLIDARLRQVYPAYYLWLAWGGAHSAAAPPPLPRACT
jgi:hypothetical protein